MRQKRKHRLLRTVPSGGEKMRREQLLCFGVTGNPGVRLPGIGSENRDVELQQIRWAGRPGRQIAIAAYRSNIDP
jgi:hypothetical protein